MEKGASDCPFPGCFFCVMKESNPVKRRTNVAKFFKELPSQNDQGQVLAISGLWNTAMAHPNDPEFLELGIFECMASLIWKGIDNRDWLAQDQNIYIPYYAAHVIGSYTMNVEEFAEKAVQSGVISPLLELLRGRLTWVEQRVAVRALGHLATYDSTFPYVAEHDEILELSIQLAMDSLDIVYTHFLQFVDRRISYHCDLLTRGTGGVEMESRKAEEWASQLQCWSLQLINCFAFKSEFLPVICRQDFVARLPGMWGGLVNETSPAGVGLLRTICHQRAGRPSVAECPGVVESLCNIACSSDDWQCMAVDCLIWLLQDTDTRFKVLDKAATALVDLVELPGLGEHKRVGEFITSVLLQDYNPFPSPEVASKMSSETRSMLDNLAAFRKKMKWEKNVPKEDLQIKQAAALVVKLEGNARFSSGDIQGAALKYSEALALCPLRAKKERVVLHSNRAQCHLMLRSPKEAISDTTRALCLHNPVNRHGKSLWRRAQAYKILGLAKESLLDAIMFINECSQAPEGDVELKQNRVPEYVEKLVKKQMQASWLFKGAALKHGGIQHENDYDDFREEEDEDSEWETASDSDSDNKEDEEDGSEDGEAWESKDPEKPLRLKAGIVFKGITLQDILGPNYQNSY
ncbi:hypothetical protein Mapa_003768 [Marchantia paleacea]|nr:hypothetical protein Mapa_003768 [Marchantia paleacea]